jgi:hypothetical protein
MGRCYQRDRRLPIPTTSHFRMLGNIISYVTICGVYLFQVSLVEFGIINCYFCFYPSYSFRLLFLYRFLVLLLIFSSLLSLFQHFRRSLSLSLPSVPTSSLISSCLSSFHCFSCSLFPLLVVLLRPSLLFVFLNLLSFPLCIFFNFSSFSFLVLYVLLSVSFCFSSSFVSLLFFLSQHACFYSFSFSSFSYYYVILCCASSLLSSCSRLFPRSPSCTPVSRIEDFRLIR